VAPVGFDVVANGGRVDLGRRLFIGGSLTILAGLAWAWTVSLADMPGCQGMPMPSFLLMWTVMMAAMMFPAVIPVVVAFVSLSGARGASTAITATAFVIGYLVVWGLLGVPAQALLSASASAVAAMPVLARTAGPILIACGVYQLTPLKDACLRHCRVPHLFLGHHWRDGVAGAFVLGAHHGLFCAGCCASLMIVLLVVGVMDVGWMVALSVLIYLEKVLPAGLRLGRVAGLGLCIIGVVKLLA
jgi:predicted metal-binding membrane protein